MHAGKVFYFIPAHFNSAVMDQITLPENGSPVRFKRFDDNSWRDGEYDAENKMFIEIYSTELTTHSWTDVRVWEVLNV